MAGKSDFFLHPRKGPVPKPTDTVSHVSHGMGDHATGHAVPGNIARDGAPKHVHAILTHGGQHRTTGTNIGAPKSETLKSIPDASSPLARDPTKPGKVMRPVAAVPGQRSRTSRHDPALGAAILQEACERTGGPDHPANLGRTK